MFGKLLAASVLGALVVASLASASCGGGSEAPLDCSTVKTPKTYTEISKTILAKCTNCHSTERTGDARHGATAGYDYNTFAAAAAAGPLGAADVSGTGNNIMPPVGQNCPSTTATKCVTDNNGAVPDLTDQERLDFQSFVCMPTQ